MSIISLTDGGYLLSFEDRPVVIRFDSDLKEIWRKDLQAQKIRYVSCKVSANADGSLIGVSGYKDVRIYDGAGNLRWTFTHEPWDSFAGAACFFSTDNQFLWLIAPGDHDRLYVARASDFAMVDSYILEGNQEYNYSFLATPDKEKVIIECAAGQDDAMLYLVQLKDATITLEVLHTCTDRLPGNFSPDGKELVTAPHYEEGIEIFSFPAFQQTTQLEQADLFKTVAAYPHLENEDTLDFTILFLNNETLVAFTRFGRLLLIDRTTMTCLGELLAAGNDIKAYDISGNITTDPAAMVDYAGEITGVQLDRQQRLMLTYHSGDIKWHQIPAMKEALVLT